MLTLLLLYSGVVIRKTYLQVDKTDSCTSSIYSCRLRKLYLYLQSSGILTKSTSSSNEAYSEQTTRFLLFKDYATRHKVSITAGLRRFLYLKSLYPSLNIKCRDGVHMRPPSCPSFLAILIMAQPQFVHKRNSCNPNATSLANDRAINK